MPDMAYVSIFMDNDLTHITEDPFEIKLIARLLDQIYVVQPSMFPPRYDDAPPQEYEYSQPHTSTDGTRPSAPQFPEHLSSIYHRHIEHFFAFFAGNTVFSLVSESPHGL